MLALKINDIKDFMNQLLIGETFDHFEMVETSITTFNTFSIDGNLRRDFFDTNTCTILDQKEISYSFWKEVKPYCFSVMRGKRTPLHFKIIFRLPGAQTRSVLQTMGGTFSPELVKGLFLNLQYRNKELLCTAGVSLNTFLPDKSLEQLWDSMVLDFFRRRHILFEEV